MRRVFKWIGIVLGGLVGVLALLLIGSYFSANARATRTYSVTPEQVNIPTDAAAVEQGRRWATILGCRGCHGEDLAGTVMIDDATLGYIASPNLTPGEGMAAGEEMTDADWVLAIRHGIDPHEGRAFIGMPSQNYYHLNDEDLGELIAYLKSLPPVAKDLGEIRLTFMTKVLASAGAFGETVFPAEIINHTGPRPAAVTPGATVEYGEYLANSAGCSECHGADLAGHKSPEPGAPPGANITPGGGFGGWSLETFETAMRTNKRNRMGMPWDSFAEMSDHELEALYIYLQSLPALENAIK